MSEDRRSLEAVSPARKADRRRDQNSEHSYSRDGCETSHGKPSTPGGEMNGRSAEARHEQDTGSGRQPIRTRTLLSVVDHQKRVPGDPQDDQCSDSGCEASEHSVHCRDRGSRL